MFESATTSSARGSGDGLETSLVYLLVLAAVWLLSPRKALSAAGIAKPGTKCLICAEQSLPRALMSWIPTLAWVGTSLAIACGTDSITIFEFRLTSVKCAVDVLFWQYLALSPI